MKLISDKQKFIPLLCLLFLTSSVCSKKPDEFRLQEGTPSFDLAVQLSQLIPALHPDLNRVMVVTKDFEVTSGEVIDDIYKQQGRQSAQLRELQPGQLQEFIDFRARLLAERNMLIAKAQEEGISITDEDVERVFLRQASDAGGENPYRQLLAARGMEEANVRESIRNDLIMQRFLLKTLGDEFPVSDEEVRIVYEQDKTATVRHIFKGIVGKTEEEKRAIYARMEEILERARKGEVFSTLAELYSEDPSSREKGGLYENIERGEMMRAFEYAAFTIPVGDISDKIIETPSGYHIIKVIERKKESRPLENVREEIIARIKQAKQGQSFQNYLARLKEENEFQIYTL
ncbi:MAG: peptidylprolyl isomerase [Candidatus Aminicenantes bacterium]|nr:peptidylprolyl isomerase [Candidatus Aminicenantes bacterium]